MPKPRGRPRHRQSPLPEHPQQLPPRLPNQRHRHPSIRQQIQLGLQPPLALRALVRRRPVRRRRTTHDRRHIRIAQLQPIAPLPALRLVRKAGAMQRSKQEIARPVTRKHPPGPVAPMRRRRQPYEQHPRRRIPKPGNRPTPIRLVSVRRPLRPRRFLPPGHQPRTLATGMHPLRPAPPVRSRGRGRTRHPLKERSCQRQQVLRPLLLDQVSGLLDDSNLRVAKLLRQRLRLRRSRRSVRLPPKPAAPDTASRQWRPHSPMDPPPAASPAAPQKTRGFRTADTAGSTSASVVSQASYRPSICPVRTYQRCA